MTVKISTGGTAAALDREPFFYIDDVEYTIPKEVPANTFIAYLDDLAKTGSEQVSQAKLLTALIGPDAMNALATCPYLSGDDMGQLLAAVADKVTRASAKYAGK